MSIGDVLAAIAAIFAVGARMSLGVMFSASGRSGWLAVFIAVSSGMGALLEAIVRQGNGR